MNPNPLSTRNVRIVPVIVASLASLPPRTAPLCADHFPCVRGFQHAFDPRLAVVADQAAADRSAPETAAEHAPASPTYPLPVESRGDRVGVAVALVCDAAVGDADLTDVSHALRSKAKWPIDAHPRRH